MGLHLERQKQRNLKLSLAYILGKFLPLINEAKIRLYLDLSWIFSRLAHEQIVRSNIQINSNSEEDFLVSFIERNASVLDLGCGQGHVISRILDKTENIVGVDYDKSAIAKAMQKFNNTQVELICADVFSYLEDYESDKFDFIILSHILEHIENPGPFLHKLKKYSNYFYIEVPDLEASHLNLYRVKMKTDLVYTDADHVSEFDRMELGQMLSQCNLNIIKSEFRFGVMKFWCKKEQ